MPSINTWLYTEIDDGSGEIIKLGSRVKPQRSYTLGSSTNEPCVYKNTYHVEVGPAAAATQIFDLEDLAGPTSTDEFTIVEIWLRSRGMNAVVSMACDPTGNFLDSVHNNIIELKDGVWQPLMSGRIAEYLATAETRAEMGTDDRENIVKMFAVAFDDASSAAGYALVDVVVVYDVIPA